MYWSAGQKRLESGVRHSSIKVTESYLKGFDAEALDAEMENLFSER